MKHHDPLYFTADADTWCPECAERAYPGATDLARADVMDKEGNLVSAVYGFDPLPMTGVQCNACHAELVMPDLPGMHKAKLCDPATCIECANDKEEERLALALAALRCPACDSATLADADMSDYQEDTTGRVTYLEVGAQCVQCSHRFSVDISPNIPFHDPTQLTFSLEGIAA